MTVKSWRGLLAGGFVALAVGGVVGVYLEFQSWNDNGAFVALAVNALGVLVALIAAFLWFRGRRAARFLAVGAGTFVLGALMGAWIAPSAHPPGWSAGSMQLTLTVPISATSSGPAECLTTGDGAVSVSSIGGQTIDGKPVLYFVGAPGVDRNPGGLSFSLAVGPPDGTEARWDSNVEGDAHTLGAEGTAASGALSFKDVSRSAKAPGSGGFGGSGDVTVSGVVSWNCETPRGVPTPIEGSWFH